MTTVGLRQQGSEALGPGSNLCRVNYFYDSLAFVRNSNGSHGTVGRTTGFSSGKFGFRSQLLPTFFNLIITMGNRNTPPPPLFLCMKSFDTRSFLEPGRVRLRNLKFFGRDKKISTENRDTPPPPPPLLSLKFSDTRFFPKHRRVPIGNVSVL